MGQDSNIEWCNHTFNPWRGCTKVSAGCQHCYADTLSRRNPLTLGVWGPNGTRVVAAEAAWGEPVKWDRVVSCNVSHGGPRPRVFCASLADVFEDWRGPMVNAAGVKLWKAWHADTVIASEERPKPRFAPLTMDDVRARLFDLICRTPNLDWLVLTKRPENALRMMVEAGLYAVANPALPCPQPNLWIGTSVEDQRAADERIPHLLATPAAVRFLSCEPLLGPVRIDVVRGTNIPPGTSPPHTFDARFRGLHWVIAGGESGPGARPCRVEWVRSLVRQCKAAAVPCFVKQLGEHVVDRNDHFGGSPDFDDHWPDDLDPMRVEHDIHGFREEYQGADCRVRLLDRKGGDPAEWPADLRVREFPHVA